MAESQPDLLPDCTHQPKSHNFPKRKFGQKSVVHRSFQSSWFDRWNWLHYCEAKDVVYCFVCLRANVEKKLIWSGNADSAFITTGFCNWKDAYSKFDKHQASKCHAEAVLKTVTVPATTCDVGESQHEKQEN